MRPLKSCVAIITLLFSCFFCNCYAQSVWPLHGKVLLVKITEREDKQFSEAIINGKISLFNKIAKQFHFVSVKKASLLQDNRQMSRWLEICFIDNSDSMQLLDALKRSPFISCVQNKPSQLLASSDGMFKPAEANDSIPWFIKQTHIPELWKLPKKRNIKIAIVDDGVRLSHKDIIEHIWTNPNEIPNNNKDDDGDGFIDDVHGWDVSDGDNNVSPPENRLPDFYHGTHIAGEIALATPHLPGDKFSIDIVPVKCLSDHATLTYINDGYKGIEYAIKIGADIINCSWGGGEFSQYEKDLLQAAADKNILIIASAGNYPTEKEQYPAAGKNVIAVTGLDANNVKPHNFNYGPFIGLSAPGVDIEGASVLDDSSRTLESGTSDATPVVTAIAALLMSSYPLLKAKDVEMILTNSATPVDEINAPVSGKLGAGLVNALKAMQQLSLAGNAGGIDTVINTKGYLSAVKSNSFKLKQHTWFIHPYGHYTGIRIYLPPSYTGSKGDISVYRKKISDSTRIANYNLQQLPDSVFAAEDSLWVVLNADKLQKDFTLTIPYSVQTVDSSCLYCSGTKIFTTPEGVFDDGSKENNYAGREDCKWLIEAPPGKKITLEFTAFVTEPRKDFVYIFDGDQTNDKIIALFSGPNIPPTVVSPHNKLLVWFVTTETIHGKGWQAKYTIQ